MLPMSNDALKNRTAPEVERYNTLVSWLQARFFIVDKHLEKHDHRFDEVYHSIELLKRQNTRRFKAENARLGDLKDLVTSLGGRVLNVEHKQAAITRRLDGIDAKITDLNAKIDCIVEKLDLLVKSDEYGSP